MSEGLGSAWDQLTALPPRATSLNARASYDETSGCYVLRTLGADVVVAPGGRTLMDATGGTLLLRHRFHAEYAILWYMALARDIGLAGRLVRPDELRGGMHFFTGTHRLPLGQLAGRYNGDLGAMHARALSLGGTRAGYGDVSYELRPVPRIPVTVILWAGDDEFEPRADLLFDASASHQVPIDVNWSIAMLTLECLLEGPTHPPAQ